jgi:hypothetical protein
LLPQKNAELLRNKNYTHYHLGCNQILIKGWLNIDFLMNSPSPVGEFYSEPLSPDNKNFFLNYSSSVTKNDSCLNYTTSQITKKLNKIHFDTKN